jgi:tetratricopeptide (TPR) repeat protein
MQHDESVENLQMQINQTVEPSELAELHVRLGYAFSQKKDHTEALAMFEKAIRLDEASAIQNEAYMRAAMEAYYSGSYEKSIDYFRHELPDHLTSIDRVNIAIFMGDVFARTNQLEDALEKYANAVTILFDITEPHRSRLAKDVHERTLYVIKTLRKSRGQLDNADI